MRRALDCIGARLEILNTIEDARANTAEYDARSDGRSERERVVERIE